MNAYSIVFVVMAIAWFIGLGIVIRGLCNGSSGCIVGFAIMIISYLLLIADVKAIDWTNAKNRFEISGTVTDIYTQKTKVVSETEWIAEVCSADGISYTVCIGNAEKNTDKDVETYILVGDEVTGAIGPDIMRNDDILTGDLRTTNRKGEK